MNAPDISAVAAPATPANDADAAPTPAAEGDTVGGTLASGLIPVVFLAGSAAAAHAVLGSPLPWQLSAWWHLITSRPGFVDVLRLVAFPAR